MAFPGDRKPAAPFSSIAGLNTLPSDYDLAMQQQENYNMDKELDIFTNANFLDWDTGDNVDQSFDPLAWQTSNEHSPSGAVATEYANGSNQLPTLSTVSSNKPFPAPTQPVRQTYHTILAANDILSPTTPTSATTPAGTKRRHDSTVSATLDVDDDLKDSALDVSAEEDKRRRNTAASARFRVKKKQREQAMEKTAKEMTDKVTVLESRVYELEKENQLLKGLLTEKTGKESPRRKAEQAAR